MVKDCEKLKKRERCPTRQTNPEENLSCVRNLWQEEPPERKVLERRRCAP